MKSFVLVTFAGMSMLAGSFATCLAGEAVTAFGLVSKIIHFDHIAVLGDISSVGPVTGARPRRRVVTMRVTEVLRGPLAPGDLAFSWEEFSDERYFDGTERDVLVFLGRRRTGADLWHYAHLSILGTDYTEVLRLTKALEGIRDIQPSAKRWRALKELLMEKLDSSSPMVAREALDGIVGDVAMQNKDVLQAMDAADTRKLLDRLEKGNPVTEFHVVLSLGALKKLDISQRLVDYADDADAVKTALKFERDLDPSLPDRSLIEGQRRANFLRTLMDVGRQFRGRVNSDSLYTAARADPEKRGWAVLLLAGLKDARAESLLVQRLKKGHTELREGRLLGLYQSKSAFKALADLYSNPPTVKDPGKVREAAMAGLLRVRSPEAEAFLAKSGATKGKTSTDIVNTYGDVEMELQSERQADEMAKRQ